MANTFELIASSTVGSGGASSIDFTSIPSTYTDLQLVTSIRESVASVWDNMTIDFNGSTANQTMRSLITSDGSTTGSQSFSRFYDWINGSSATASTFSNVTMYIPNYAGSTNKSMSIDSVAENNGTNTFMLMAAYLWSSTAAINRITLTPNTGTFLQYSTAYLYGVKNA